jgi:hypothetical protein
VCGAQQGGLLAGGATRAAANDGKVGSAANIGNIALRAGRVRWHGRVLGPDDCRVGSAAHIGYCALGRLWVAGHVGVIGSNYVGHWCSLSSMV